MHHGKITTRRTLPKGAERSRTYKNCDEDPKPRRRPQTNRHANTQTDGRQKQQTNKQTCQRTTLSKQHTTEQDAVRFRRTGFRTRRRSLSYLHHYRLGYVKGEYTVRVSQGTKSTVLCTYCRYNALFSRRYVSTHASTHARRLQTAR